MSARPTEKSSKPSFYESLTTMSSLRTLEFVLVSADYSTLTAVSAGVKKFGAALTFVPNSESARNCLARRKIDAVFVDHEVPGALQFIESIRKGASNSRVVIFACVADSVCPLQRCVLVPTSLKNRSRGRRDTASLAKELMMSERRRYFRHPVNLHVLLKDEDSQQHAKITDLSDGGMAVRTARPLKHSSLVEFEFDLSFGTNLTGKGQVAWTNTEGVA